MNRMRPPNRRQSGRIKFWQENQKFYGTYSRFDDGRLAEVFLQCGKAGSNIEAMARDFAVIASLALQNGVTLDELRAAVTRHDDGKAAGPGGLLFDLVAKELNIEGGETA